MYRCREGAWGVVTVVSYLLVNDCDIIILPVCLLFLFNSCFARQVVFSVLYLFSINPFFRWDFCLWRVGYGGRVKLPWDGSVTHGE